MLRANHVMRCDELETHQNIPRPAFSMGTRPSSPSLPDMLDEMAIFLWDEFIIYPTKSSLRSPSLYQQESFPLVQLTGSVRRSPECRPVLHPNTLHAPEAGS